MGIFLTFFISFGFFWFARLKFWTKRKGRQHKEEIKILNKKENMQFDWKIEEKRMKFEIKSKFVERIEINEITIDLIANRGWYSRVILQSISANYNKERRDKCILGMIFSPPCIEVLHFAKSLYRKLCNKQKLRNWKEISKLWFHSKDNNREQG